MYFSKYTIFKLPKGNICQISRKTSALKIQSNSEYCFMKRDLKCGWRSFCKRAERNTCLLQPTCNVSLSRIFFVNAREQLQCRKHVVIYSYHFVYLSTEMEHSSSEPQTYCPSDSITQHTLLRTQHLNQIYRCILVTSNFQSLLITWFSSVYIVWMYAVRIKHLLKSITLPKPPIMLQNSKGSDFFKFEIWFAWSKILSLC